MATSTYVQQEPALPSAVSSPIDLKQSGVSWAAIFAGALAAAVLSLLLFILGIGLGLSSISVWSGRGAAGDTIGWTAVVWLAFTQLASAGVGGYLAGRLRTRWQGVHTDEVYFRDTAHGFLSWSLATLLMVALMGSVVGSAITGAVKSAGAVASGAASLAGGAVGAAGTAAAGAIGAYTAKDGDLAHNSLSYWINSLFRNEGLTEEQKDQMKANAHQTAHSVRSAAEITQEVTGIFIHGLQDGKLSDDDARYVAQLISERSGVSPAQAQDKVQNAFQKAHEQFEQAKLKAKEIEEKTKQAAETARKATAYSMLWLFVALLVGAFVASLCATWGGRMRDA